MGRLPALIRAAPRRGRLRRAAAVVGAGGLLGGTACLAPVANLPHRADQVAAIVADAERSAGPVVLAGDFNSYAIGRWLERRGSLWLTKAVTNSIWFFSWDHIFARGFGPAMPPCAGTAPNGGASDHRPVWAVLSLPPPGTARAYQSRSSERPPLARRPKWLASCSRSTASRSRRASEGLSSSTDSPSPEPNPPPAIAPTAASGFPS